MGPDPPPEPVVNGPDLEVALDVSPRSFDLVQRAVGLVDLRSGKLVVWFWFWFSSFLLFFFFFLEIFHEPLFIYNMPFMFSFPYFLFSFECFY